MKKIVCAVLLCVIIFACKKDGVTIYNQGLIGKWELTEYYIAPGPPGEWHAANDQTRHTAEFKTNGDFISNGYFYFGATAFTQVDSARIQFLNATQTQGELIYFFELNNDNSILTVSPLCIEGCSYRYKAVIPGE